MGWRLTLFVVFCFALFFTQSDGDKTRMNLFNLKEGRFILHVTGNF